MYQNSRADAETYSLAMQMVTSLLEAKSHTPVEAANKAGKPFGCSLSPEAVTRKKHWQCSSLRPAHATGLPTKITAEDEDRMVNLKVILLMREMRMLRLTYKHLALVVKIFEAMFKGG